METFTGTVSKLKIISYAEQPLVRFTLTADSDKPINCLIHQDALNFLADVDDQSTIAAYGYFNQRHQFILRKYTVIGLSSIQYFYQTSPYPHAKH